MERNLTSKGLARIIRWHYGTKGRSTLVIRLPLEICAQLQLEKGELVHVKITKLDQKAIEEKKHLEQLGIPTSRAIYGLNSTVMAKCLLERS